MGCCAAIEGGYENIMKLLVELQVDIEARLTLRTLYELGGLGLLTPLRCAAGYGHAYIMRILIEAGAKTDVLDKDEPSRLALAVIGGHTETTRQLIENGSDVNEQRNKSVRRYSWLSMPLLHIAVEDGDVEILKLLIENGVDTQARCRLFERTALEKAIEQQQEAAQSGGLEVFRGHKRVKRTVEEFNQIISLLEQRSSMIWV